jgi:aspartate kinase
MNQWLNDAMAQSFNSPLTVMKFGGTSVEDATSVERVAGIILDRLAKRPVVVVSAMGKTTRNLLKAAEGSAAGDRLSVTAVIDDLKARHLSEARRLIDDGPGSTEFPLIEKYFEELKRLLEGLAVLGDVPPRGLDKILSYGELLSSVIVSGALVRRGIPTTLLDAREFIKTDDRYGMASPIFELTNQLTRGAVQPVIESGSVPVIQGFIGSARHGATTTLGFEGSDYTAAIVAAALGATDLQIWKDVSGLMTADPKIMPSARTVKACTYAEAGELTYFGSKVLHPKAIYPAAEKKIPVHIYNSRQPSASGTVITSRGSHRSVPSANPIKSIAYKRPMSVIRITASSSTQGFTREGRSSPPDGIAVEGFLRMVLDRCARRAATPLIATATGSNAVIAMASADLKGDNGRYLMDEIRELGSVEVDERRAVISVVGEELKAYPGLASRMLQAIDGIDIGMVLHGSSPIAINIIIGQDDVEQVVSRLHELFFSQLDPAIFE